MISCVVTSYYSIVIFMSLITSRKFNGREKKEQKEEHNFQFE